MNAKTLYERLGGYDAIAAVVGNLLPRMQVVRDWPASISIVPRTD